jgi:hypothetical protein
MQFIGTAILVVAVMVGRAHAEDTPPDRTPITDCDKLPRSAIVGTFGNSDVVPVCREVMKVLSDVTVYDLRNFETAVSVFSSKGYKEKQYGAITAEIVDIIRLRGQRKKESQWFPTIEIVWKSYHGTYGAVTPHDVVGLLRAAGPAAKELSDDGLYEAIVILKHMKQDDLPP